MRAPVLRHPRHVAVTPFAQKLFKPHARGPRLSCGCNTYSIEAQRARSAFKVGLCSHGRGRHRRSL
jgi:hypothetical protein